MQNFINVINDLWGTLTEFYYENDLLILFVVLNVTNVIIQTIKSLATVKCGKTVAALVNAVAYGLYTVVTIYMLCDLGRRKNEKRQAVEGRSNCSQRLHGISSHSLEGFEHYT